ncbi:hypothetical protein BKA65DRAFT_491261 [Rhexocercosporidium sp. MPI-PUGE-AT-0058]|nr:hypothetical protein BKA65DRAFT_491261 [Rhexocercosporidium sp. MPI-PUGE-AT-0058]
MLIHESFGSRLVRMQQRFVMRFGVQVNPIEAHNMMYVAKSSTVPVHRVYAIYQSPSENKSVVIYIVMDMTLLELWAKLDQAHKLLSPRLFEPTLMS